MKEKLKLLTFQLEASFILTVIRHGLALMIPFVVTGGLASAIVNFPLPSYQRLIEGSFVVTLLNTINTGTFGIFSVAMLISLCASYSMEKNMTADKTVMFVLVGLASYGAQLYTPDANYNLDMFGVKGCFFAIVTALVSCRMLEFLHDQSILRLRNYTFGLERITAVAISMLLPAICVISSIMLVTRLILMIAGEPSLYKFISDLMCSIFRSINSQFAEGLLYTLLVHLLWVFGLHGNDILEPVASTRFALDGVGTVFNKPFFDIYVIMGGCGTTMCVLVAYLLFFRKSRMKMLAKISAFTVTFNINEILTFGIPIILNPIMVIPFMVTPLFCYVTAYIATARGWVPPVVNDVVWSTPIIFSGYAATGSIRGSILQILMVIVGMGFYYPFLKMNMETQEEYAKEQMADVVKLLQEKEENNETIDLLTQSNRKGQITRMLRHDLERAIEKNELYMLYQPQVDSDGVCIGAEALLRWKHPLYGFIYPPLIMYLAKEGGMLENLEKRIIDNAAAAAAEVKKAIGDDFKISINLTAKSLLWEVEEYIDEQLKKNGVLPSQFWIEITEQDVLSKASKVMDKLEKLKAKGHVLMIDDFGMGHTSILYLQSSQFGVVKIDGSLVKNVLENKTNQQIISSIVSLADNLDVKTIAEFVETQEQRDKLYELGCKWYQGYLYMKAVPLEEFITYIKANGRVEILRK